jgi:hypothetical protein
MIDFPGHGHQDAGDEVGLRVVVLADQPSASSRWR